MMFFFLAGPSLLPEKDFFFGDLLGSGNAWTAVSTSTPYFWGPYMAYGIAWEDDFPFQVVELILIS